jgi:hypothetical protein
MNADTIPLRRAAADPVKAECNDSAGRPTPQAPAVEPLAVGREQAAALFSISVASWDRWDAGGLLGPRGIKKAGRKLWILAELRAWAAQGMPCRKDWLALKLAKSSNSQK